MFRQLNHRAGYAPLSPVLHYNPGQGGFVGGNF
jgi:hypothetical protein